MTLPRELDKVIPPVLIFFWRMGERTGGGALTGERKLRPLG
jgi:hypothetical protein